MTDIPMKIGGIAPWFGSKRSMRCLQRIPESDGAGG